MLCSNSFGQTDIKKINAINQQHAIALEEINKLFDKAEKAINKQETHKADSLINIYFAECNTDELQNTFEYTKLLSYKANQIAAQGHLDKAIELGKTVVNKREIAPNCEKHHLATSINELAIYYSYKGDYNKAIELERKAIDLFISTKHDKDINYSLCLSNLATFLSYRGMEGDYQEAALLGEQSIKRIKKNSYAYINALNSLIVYYSQLGNVAKADEYSKELKEKGKKLYGNNSNDYAILLNNFGIRWANLHNFPKAIEYCNKAKDIYLNNHHTHNLNYGNLLINLATFNKQVDNYKETIKLLKEAQPLLKDIVEQDIPTISAVSVNWLLPITISEIQKKLKK